MNVWFKNRKPVRSTSVSWHEQGFSNYEIHSYEEGAWRVAGFMKSKKLIPIDSLLKMD